MKRKDLSCVLLLSTLCLSGCDLGSLFGTGSNSNIHTSSYEAITGKFVLYDALDK